MTRENVFFSARAALAAALLVACSSEAEVQTKVVRGTAVDHGRALFNGEVGSGSPLNDYACSTCHLAEPDAGDTRMLTGATLAGAPLRPTFWGGQENDLLRSINNCRFYFMLNSQPWAAEDEEAEATYAYLVSLPGGDAGAQSFTVVSGVTDVAPGDGARGAQVFASACSACHGAAHTGEGRISERAPTLPEQTLMDHVGYSADDKRLVFVQKVRHGGFMGYGGTMPPFSLEALSDAQLGDLLSFLGLYSQ